MTLNAKKATAAQIAEGLELLEKANIRKEKIKSGEIKGGMKWSELSDEQKDKRRMYSRKRNARIAVMVQKALAKGITLGLRLVADYMASSTD